MKEYLKTLFKFSDGQLEGKVTMRVRISGKFPNDTKRVIYLETFNHETQCLFLDPLYAHTDSIIFLHGYTRNWQVTYKMIAGGPKMLFPGTFRYVIPTAKERKINVYPGKDFSRPSWFDYTELNKYPTDANNIEAIQSTSDQESLLQASEDVISLIKIESDMLTPSNVFLGGFSQGCATALAAFLKNGQELGSVIGICGTQDLKAANWDENEELGKTPMFVLTGLDDKSLP